MTGETDIISDDSKITKNKSRYIYLTKITGAGCMIGSLITASLTASNNLFKAITETVYFYRLAAEYAITNNSVNGPGSFIPHFLDALSLNLLKENS